MLRGYKQIVFIGLFGLGINANSASIPFDINGRLADETIFSSESDNGFWVQNNQWVISGGRIIQLTHSLVLTEVQNEPSHGFVQFTANHAHEANPAAHPNPNFPDNIFPFEDFPLSTFPSEHYPDHFDELPYPWTQSPVPIPAAAWLFVSGLVGLYGMFRRK